MLNLRNPKEYESGFIVRNGQTLNRVTRVWPTMSEAEAAARRLSASNGAVFEILSNSRVVIKYHRGERF